MIDLEGSDRGTTNGEILQATTTWDGDVSNGVIYRMIIILMTPPTEISSRDKTMLWCQCDELLVLMMYPQVS